jgi:hypothetical protein
MTRPFLKKGLMLVADGIDAEALSGIRTPDGPQSPLARRKTQSLSDDCPTTNEPG